MDQSKIEALIKEKEKRGQIRIPERKLRQFGSCQIVKSAGHRATEGTAIPKPKLAAKKK